MSGANDSKRKSRMMKSYKFKLGDRVRCIVEVDGNKGVKGKVGTIKKVIWGDLMNYAVEFDDPINGHNCGSIGDSYYCADGHGWWCLGSCLEPADESPSPSDIKISFEEMFSNAAET